ncbi:hypothetical protein EEJ31_06570 [Cryobacterium tepidiphilum]|uniref:Uncharacterized protein n=1 Tax=Cryobacterium tepidiphilum TaxID=2486026 RepID=A0A3M8LDS8_9MICO|nr:hypothetical protein EEJ31_06570 [Cryobacterium tepidiphilum]
MQTNASPASAASQMASAAVPFAPYACAMSRCRVMTENAPKPMAPAMRPSTTASTPSVSITDATGLEPLKEPSTFRAPIRSATRTVARTLTTAIPSAPPVNQCRVIVAGIGTSAASTTSPTAPAIALTARYQRSAPCAPRSRANGSAIKAATPAAPAMKLQKERARYRLASPANTAIAARIAQIPSQYAVGLPASMSLACASTTATAAICTTVRVTCSTRRRPSNLRAVARASRTSARATKAVPRCPMAAEITVALA